MTYILVQYKDENNSTQNQLFWSAIGIDFCKTMIHQQHSKSNVQGYFILHQKQKP